MTFGPSNTVSTYLPPEFQLTGEMQDIVDLIAQRERQTASIVNIKENANYQNLETLTAQQWFSTNAAGQPKVPRYTFRKVIDFGALPAAAGAKSVAHGISAVNANFIFTKISAVARNPAVPFWLPIPYVIPGGTDHATNVNIQVATATYAAYTQCYVVLEYIKG
jgi:hypothetical protein